MVNLVKEIHNKHKVPKGDICLILNISEEYFDLLLCSKTINNRSVNTVLSFIIKEIPKLKICTVEEYIDTVIKKRKTYGDLYYKKFCELLPDMEIKKEYVARVFKVRSSSFERGGALSASFADIIKKFEEEEHTDEALISMYLRAMNQPQEYTPKGKKISFEYYTKERITPLDRLRRMGLPKFERNGIVMYRYKGKNVKAHDLLYKIRNGEI